MICEYFDEGSWPDGEQDRERRHGVRTIGETLEELRAQYRGLFSETEVAAPAEAVGVG